jgi:acetyl-CoA carboxylase carboxyl transferase subunit alpha
MKMTAPDLRDFRIIDGILAEPGAGAHTDHQAIAATVRQQVLRAYDELSKKRVDQLLRERSARLLSLGDYRAGEETVSRGLFARLFSGRRGG